MVFTNSGALLHRLVITFMMEGRVETVWIHVGSQKPGNILTTPFCDRAPNLEERNMDKLVSVRKETKITDSVFNEREIEWTTHLSAHPHTCTSEKYEKTNREKGRERSTEKKAEEVEE